MFMRKPFLAMTGLVTCLSLALTPISAEVVTLNSLDGTVSMTGDLLGFDGDTYQLNMQMGEISVDAAQVECEGPGCPNLLAALSSFSIAGSEEIGNNLLPTLIEVFALERGGDIDVTIEADGTKIYNVLEGNGDTYASITVATSDSADGFAGLLEGSAVIGMSSRRAGQNEVAAFEGLGKGRLDSPEQEHIVALDGVIVAVNRDNPVSILSLEQIARIFDGTYSNWQQVGGDDAPISLFRRSDDAGSSIALDQIAMAPRSRRFAANVVVLGADALVSDAVAADVNAIGISSYAQERNARALAIRSVCGQLFEPSEFSIKAEEYMLSRRMYLYTAKGAVPDIAKDFIEFATSPAAQSVIANSGFIGQNASSTSLDQQGRRMAQAIVASAGRTELLQLQDLTAIVLDAERLSFTLRFDESGQLDSRAMADVERLAAMIRNGEFSSRQILVFGFSDNSDGVNAQLGLTQDLAQNVRDAIVTATGRANLGNVRISPIGYGRLLPLGCNETEFGRASNNRVEIWVK